MACKHGRKLRSAALISISFSYSQTPVLLHSGLHCETTDAVLVYSAVCLFAHHGSYRVSGFFAPLLVCRLACLPPGSFTPWLVRPLACSLPGSFALWLSPTGFFAPSPWTFCPRCMNTSNLTWRFIGLHNKMSLGLDSLCMMMRINDCVNF